MKYRILLLAALMGAVLVSGVGGTLAGYTDETALSFSIRPDTGKIRPKAQRTVEVPEKPADGQAAESMPQSDEEQPTADPSQETPEKTPDKTPKKIPDKTPADDAITPGVPQDNE